MIILLPPLSGFNKGTRNRPCYYKAQGKRAAREDCAGHLSAAAMVPIRHRAMKRSEHSYYEDVLEMKLAAVRRNRFRLMAVSIWLSGAALSANAATPQTHGERRPQNRVGNPLRKPEVVFLESVVKRVEPTYPRQARASNIIGIVVLEVKVNGSGNVAEARAPLSVIPGNHAAGRGGRCLAANLNDSTRSSQRVDCAAAISRSAR